MQNGALDQIKKKKNFDDIMNNSKSKKFQKVEIYVLKKE